MEPSPFHRSIFRLCLIFVASARASLIPTNTLAAGLVSTRTDRDDFIAGVRVAAR